MKKIISFVMALSSVIMVLSGCQSSSRKDEFSFESISFPDGAAGPENQNEKSDFVIYRPPSAAAEWVMQGLAQFNMAYGKEINIIFEDFSSNREGYQQRITTELLAGGGPDVIFLQDARMNYEKVMRIGAFLDLTPYMEQDKDFHKEDYLNHIFDAGCVDGKQYIVPVSVYPPVLIGNATQLESVGIREISKGNTASFLRQIAEASQLAEQNPGFSQMMQTKGYFTTFCKYSALQLIDYNQKIVCPDEKKIREFFEAYKQYYKYDCVTGNNYGFFPFLGLQPVTEGYYVDCAPQVSRFIRTASLLKTYGGYTIAAMRNADGEMIMPYSELMAVRANTKNPDYAYQLIKIYLSPAVQNEIGSGTDDAPIYRETISKEALFWQARLTDGKKQDEYVYTQLTDKEVQEYLSLFEEVSGGSIPRWTEYTMAWESMEPFFKDENSYEACFEELKSKLFLYLDE